MTVSPQTSFPHLSKVQRTGCFAARFLGAIAGGCLGLHGYAEDRPFRLSDLSIEELMNESVTSVSKKATSLDHSPAAITVITGEEILQLGFTSIPEALRLVPGLHVGQISANQWAVSSRGFSSQFSNKLLVLMDGRSVYTPSFGGVFWDSQDMMLEDLERIEVIRGPGATLWGANAVNGVINIISKNSKDTQGGLFSSSFGNLEQPTVSLRYGGAVGTDLHYRAYVKYFNRDGFVDSQGHSTPDDWDSIRTGFRSDWQATGEDLFTLQGDYYSLHTGAIVSTPTLLPPFDETSGSNNHSRGGNILGRWTRTLSEDSHVMLQSYFDNFSYESGTSYEDRSTADVQLEHRFGLGKSHDVLWGVGYRFTTDEFTDTPWVVWSPASADLNLYTAFLQDEITLVPDRLRFIIGTKVEHNDYTGWEIQPSGRLLFTPTDNQTFWASASRATGTPARVQESGRVNISSSQPPFSPVIQTAIIGSSSVVSETLDAYEVGYRIKPAKNVSIDVTGFYNIYEDLQGITMGTPGLQGGSTPYVLVPLVFDNSQSGKSYGIEASVQWKPVDRWKLTANYSWLSMDLQPLGLMEDASPEQQVSLRSHLNLPRNLEFNTFVSYVDGVRTLNQAGATESIPSYVRVDAGIVWRPRENIEVGLWGHNLLDSHHPEMSSQSTNVITEVPRSVVGKITIRF